MTSSRASWSAPYGAPAPNRFDRDASTVDGLASELTRLASDGEIAAARDLATYARRRFPEEPRFVRWTEVLLPPVVWVSAGPAAMSGVQVRAWLAEHGAQHVGTWVVLENGSAVASGPSLDDVRGVLETRPGAIALHVHEDLLGG